MTFADLQCAVAVFGLSGRVTLSEIKSRHRQLVKRHHPDRGGEEAPERIREINAAYGILLAYCEIYRFSFNDEEFCLQNPDELLRRQFAHDPIWGGG